MTKPKKSEVAALNKLKMEIIALEEKLKVNKGAEAGKLQEFLNVSRKAVEDALKGKGGESASDLKQQFSAVRKAFDDFKNSSAPVAKTEPEAKALVKNAPKATEAVESFPAGDKSGKYLYVRGARKVGDGVERVQTIVRGQDMAEAQVKAVTWLKSQDVDIGETVGSANKNFRIVDFEEAGIANPVRTAKDSLKPTEFAQSIEARYNEERRNFLKGGGKKAAAPATLETMAEQEVYESQRAVVAKSKQKAGKGKEAPDEVARAGGAKAGDIEIDRDERLAAEAKASTEAQLEEIKKKGVRQDALKQADDVIAKGFKAGEIDTYDPSSVELLKRRLAAGTQGMDEAGVDAFEKMKRQVLAGNFDQAVETAKQVPTINDPIKLGKGGKPKKARVYAGSWVDPKALVESPEWKNTLGIKDVATRTTAQKRLRVVHLIETGVFNVGHDVRGLVGTPQMAVVLQDKIALDMLDKVGRNAKLAAEGPQAARYLESTLTPVAVALNKVAEGRGDLKNFREIDLRTSGKASPFVKNGDLKKEFVSQTSAEAAAIKQQGRIATARKTEAVAADEALSSEELEKRVNRVKGEIAKIEERNPNSSELDRKRASLNELERRYKAKLEVERVAKANAATMLSGQGETGAVAVELPNRTLEQQLEEAEKQLANARNGKDPITGKRSLKAKNQVKALEQRVASLKQSLSPAAERAGIGAAAMGAADIAMEAAVPAAAPAGPPGPNLKSQKLPRTPARRALLQARAAKMGLGQGGMATAGRVGMSGLRFLGPLAAIFGAYQIASALKGQTIDEADERRLRVMQALGAVGGGMGQEMQQREQIRAMSRMVDLAAVQRQAQRDELNKQYTGNMALDALLRGQEATLSTLAQPSRPSMAEMMMRM